MARRSYNQSCGIARALDLLGERWTLLIVRDLLIGPRRYSDLLEGLPGIGTNLLADRLKLLEAEHLVCKRHLAPPADRVVVYELTEAGRELEEILEALVRWSWRHLGPAHAQQHADPRWTALALRASFDPEAAAGLEASYEFDLGGQKVFVRVKGRRIQTGIGPATNPDVVLRSDDHTLSEIRAGELSVDRALEQGRLELEGTQPEIDRMLTVLSRR